MNPVQPWHWRSARKQEHTCNGMYIVSQLGGAKKDEYNNTTAGNAGDL